MSTPAVKSGDGATGAAATAARLPLFRPEALAAQSDFSLGRPIALVPVSWTVLTLLLAALVGTAIVFLATANYARKETARGILRPVGGEMRVTAQRGGVVRELLVTEGMLVQSGALLAVVDTERTLASGGNADEETLAALAREEEMSRIQLAALEASIPYDMAALSAQIDALLAERSAVSALRTSSKQRLRIADERLQLARKLKVQNFIPDDELRRREEAVIVQRQTAVDAQAREAALSARIAELRARREQRPHVVVQERGRIEAQIAVLQQRRAQLQAQKGYAIRARLAGRVTALQAQIGQAVDGQRPLMTISSPDSRLEAELYVPSRGIAFVRPGQRVRLLCDAFPYERFGPAYGVVAAVSASVLTPSEVQAAIPLAEPVYRVLVRLDRSTIEAFGTALPLKPGMALTGDIILEERSFGEWLLAPLLAMRGRM